MEPILRNFLLLLACLAPLAAPAQTAVQTAAPAITVTAAKAPAVIYLFRHAEKPMEGDKNPDLTATGYHRADLLPTLFLSSNPRLRRPDVLFATARSKHSNRPVETITPLSAALKLPINNTFDDHDTAGIAQEILSGKYAGKVVVICWHHGEIATLAQALGLPAQARWHDDVFNQIWQITYPQASPTLTVVPENLLPGDSR